jgi:hypothetical protein
MSLVERISETIATKQQQTELDLSMNMRTFLASNGKGIFKRFKQHFANKI